jgi:hypothetical protein
MRTSWLQVAGIGKIEVPYYRRSVAEAILAPCPDKAR